ncbi:metallophosphoesterase [Polaromonas sp.]|uniref:metallophosphoesterase family protein n=1 Tax=Polaromonas sp. TaxID=1869339 RepID=UPI00184B11D9|nr:metallophosphoesterase [Polaromonas sp.]NMM07780.1 alkaline phosphatase [Polaromonas sp.]
MHKNFWPDAMRAVRFGLTAALVGAAVVACGGGDGGGSAPPVLQANPTTPWELMTAGDIAQCLARPAADTNAEKTAQLVERQLAGAGGNANVLTLGDNAYLAGAMLGYTDCYEKTWGRFIAKTFAIPGNHDYENGNSNYYDYFGAKASPDGKRTGYYRIDQSGWTVFALNSNIDATAASAQAQWLKQELATAQPCVAAAWHHARFTSGKDGDNTTMTAMWDILDQAKADVVLQSHLHQYERFAAMTSDGTLSATGGLRSFVVGTGGAITSGFDTVRPGSEKQAQAFGVMRLSLSAGNAKWKFIDVDNAVLDEGAFDCRKKA